MEEISPLSSSRLRRHDPQPTDRLESCSSKYDVNNGNNNSSKTEIELKTSNDTVSDPIWENKYRQDLSRAYNLNSFCLHIGQSLRFMGFDEYSLYYLEDNSKPLVSIFTTMAEDEINTYFSDAQWRHDPIRDYAIKEKAGILLSTIKKYFESCPFQLESFYHRKMMFAYLDSFGYHDLYILPLRNPNKEACLILTVATKDRNIDEFHELISNNSQRLQSLVRAIEFVSTKKFPAIFLDQKESKEIQIDPNSIELLQVMVQHDMKLIDAAERLNISRDIANRSIKSAKLALRVNNTACLIYHLTKAGLIEKENADE